MKILGIDPGYRNCGYALISGNEGKKIEYITSGVLKSGQIESPFKKMAFFFNEAKRLVEELKPDQIVLESLIYVKSPTALIKLAQARGAMLAAFSLSHSDSIYEYSPNEVKLFSSGHGHSNKSSVQFLVGHYLDKKDFITHDESDALAVALCHSLRFKTWNKKLPFSNIRNQNGKSSLKSAFEHLIRKE